MPELLFFRADFEVGMIATAFCAASYWSGPNNDGPNHSLGIGAGAPSATAVNQIDS